MGSFTIYNPEYAPNEHERKKGELWQQLELARMQAAIDNIRSGRSTSFGGNDITSFLPRPDSPQSTQASALSGLINEPTPSRPNDFSRPRKSARSSPYWQDKDPFSVPQRRGY